MPLTLGHLDPPPAAALSDQAGRDLLAHVVEFLQYLDFPRTLEALAAERRDKRQAVSSSVSVKSLGKDSREKLRADMLRKFDEGKREDFLLLWQQFVPASMLGYDFETQKMEFYLQIYFAIFPVLPSSSVLVVTPSTTGSMSGSARHELAARMKAFRLYLETRGAGLAHTPEFLSYYALPYVPQPEHHPSFEALFEPSWAFNQREDLKTHLSGLCEAAASGTLPKLFEMYEAHQAATGDSARLSPRAAAMRSSRRMSGSNPGSRPGSVTSLPMQGTGLQRANSRGAGGLVDDLAGSFASPERNSIMRNRSSSSGRLPTSGGVALSRDLQHPLPPKPISPARHSLGSVSRVNSPSAIPLHPSAPSPAGIFAGSPLASPSVTSPVLPGAPPAVEPTSSAGVSSSSSSDDDKASSDEEGVATETDDEGTKLAAAHFRSTAPKRQPGVPAASGSRPTSGVGGGGKRTSSGGESAAPSSVRESLQSVPATPHEAEQEAPGAAEAPSAPRPPSARPVPPLTASSSRPTSGRRSRQSSFSGGSGPPANGTAPDNTNMSLSQMALQGGGGIMRSSAVMDSVSGGLPLPPPALLAPLDYARVKADLRGGDDGLRARLLQALRWRLVKSPPGYERWSVIAAWIEVDLLDCEEPGTQGPMLQALCSNGAGSLASEEAARLANAIVSDRMGREYLLLPDAGALPALYSLLAQQPSRPPSATSAGAAPRDTALLQQALATLQKLSLKRRAQTALIQLGCVGWTVCFMQDREGLTAFTIEYCAALLMNLVLRTAGKNAAEPLAGPLLALCEGLAESANEQIQTYVNGTLYSVLERPAVRSEAQQRGTGDLLRLVVTHTNASEAFASQTQHILQQLERPSEDGGGDGGNYPASDDEDAEDVDLHDDDSGFADVEATPESTAHAEGEPSGELLLCQGYLASADEARQHLAAVRSSMMLPSGGAPRVGGASQAWSRQSQRQSTQFQPMSRPMTPALSGSVAVPPGGFGGAGGAAARARGPGGSSLAASIVSAPPLPPPPRVLIQRESVDVGRSMEGASAQAPGAEEASPEEWAQAFGGQRNLPRTSAGHD